MSYGDYVEQLTYLLFLKMADERTKPPYSQPSTVPAAYAWPTLVKKDGDELFDHYRHTPENLGNEKGLLGLIFNKSQKFVSEWPTVNRDLWRSATGGNCRGFLGDSGAETGGNCTTGEAGARARFVVNRAITEPGGENDNR